MQGRGQTDKATETQNKAKAISAELLELNFGYKTVVFWANTVFFANTVVFWANTVVF